MNKTELIAAVAEASGKSKADVKDVLDALTAQIVKTVKAGDEITLVGFGTFKSAKREARTAILPPEQRSRFPLLFSRNSLPANSLKMPSIQNNLFLS